MFKFIKQISILLIFIRSLATKCISLNSEPCLARLTLIDLDSNKLHCYSFMVSLDRCNGSYNALDDPFI